MAKIIRRPTPGQTHKPSVNKMLNLIKTSNKNDHRPNGVPQFPGFNSGMSIEEVRRMIKDQPRTTGVRFAVAVGPDEIQNINLPGDARLFLGLIFTTVTDDSDIFTMSINNEKIVDNGSMLLHSIANPHNLQRSYFEYLRPLSGKDQLQFTTDTIGGMTGVLELHYI